MGYAKAVIFGIAVTLMARAVGIESFSAEWFMFTIAALILARLNG